MSNRYQRFTIPWAFSLLTGFCLLAGFGCSDASKSDPALHKVTGTVKLKNGKPVELGFVKFVGSSTADVTINGVTDAEGNFSLSTIMINGNRKVVGAPAGEFEVTVTLPLDSNQAGGGTVKVGKLTVKPSDDNNFPITIDPSRKGG
jgi:hypothetical protein